MVVLVATLRLDAFPFGQYFALGFCGVSRLETVICVLHLAGFPRENFGLLGLYVAQAIFRVVVFDFLGVLYIVLSGLLLLAFLVGSVLLAFLLRLAFCGQQVNCRFVAARSNIWSGKGVTVS